MKHFIILMFLAIASCDLFSQLDASSNDRAHRRYWYYRTRMINDFINIGDKQGDCNVFAQRNPGIGTDDVAVGADQIDITNQYLMALALEYKLLSRMNQSTKETVREMFYIIKTINRLDSRADWFWNPSPPTNDNMNAYPETTNLNGFMLRNDVPRNYFSSQNYKHFNYAKFEYNTTATNDNASYTGLHEVHRIMNLDNFASYTGFNVGAPGIYTQAKEDLTLPHDKYYSMFLAFMFIVKYLPDGVNHYENGILQTFQGGEADLKKEVVKITNRCHTYLRGNTFGGPGSNWVMEYPDGSNLVKLGNPKPYCFPTARIICDINSSFPFAISCDSKQDAYSIYTGKANYDILHYNIIPSGVPVIGSEDASVFLAYNQAGSNTGLNAFIPAWLAMSSNSTINFVEWADLMRKVLHQNGTLLKQMNVYADPINAAPCQGPYNMGAHLDGGLEWSSGDRLEHQSRRGDAFPDFKGNYPGVDYMLLHNLYYEYQNQLVEFPNGNTNNAGIIGGGGFGSGALANQILTYVFNGLSNSSNTIPNAVCNAVNSVFNAVFGGSSPYPCNNSNGNGGSGSAISPTPYFAYNYMDNEDASVWPNSIYIGPHPPVGGLPVGLNDPANPASPYNPSNPTGHYSNPSNFINYGTVAQPAKVAVFQNLISTSHIYKMVSPLALLNVSPASVIYRAGKDITLLPGFQVDSGATFLAYIQRYICTGNGDVMNMRQQKIYDENGITKDLTHYEEEIMNNIPIHYVENQTSYPSSYQSTDFINNNDEIVSRDFLVTPNPSNGLFKLYSAKITDDEELSYKVINMNGQIILEKQKIEIEEVINLSGYNTGIYVIQIISNQGQSHVRKIELISN